MTTSLETPKQLSDRVGLPISMIRTLIHKKHIEHVIIGRRPYIPLDSFDKYIEDNRIIPNIDDKKKARLQPILINTPIVTFPKLGVDADASAECAKAMISKSDKPKKPKK